MEKSPLLNPDILQCRVSTHTAHTMLRFIKPAALWLLINSRNYRNEKDKMSGELLLSPDSSGLSVSSPLFDRLCFILWLSFVTAHEEDILHPVSKHKASPVFMVSVRHRQGKSFFWDFSSVFNLQQISTRDKKQVGKKREETLENCSSSEKGARNPFY